MRKRFHILWMVLMGACTYAHAQDLSNRGKEFWVGYGHNDYMEPDDNNELMVNSQELVLYLSAEQDADVTVTINNTGWVRHYFVPANTVVVSDYMPKGEDASEVDCRLYSLPVRNGGTGSEGLFAKKGIHIESTTPIVAYAHGFAEGSSGASMLMPVETWGYTYYSVNTNQRGASNSFSWMFVVASHDNTVVEITPAVPTRSGRLAGVPFTATLNKGEIYQVMGAGNTDVEMTGTKVKSIANAQGQCYPIGAFSGSSGTINPMTCGYGFVDADMQQLFPMQAWGKRYLTSPISVSTTPSKPVRNAYKILVNDPATVVKVNGTVQSGLANNHYYYESRTADLIEADKPIMVAQFMTGQFGTCTGGDGNSDPDMMYISPVDQGINQIRFYRNNRMDITVNYLAMVVPNKGTGLTSLRIDGQPLSALNAADYTTYVHPQLSNYTVVIRRWSGFAAFPAAAPGQCFVTSDSAFTAVTYGLGEAESYSYNAGTHINNLHAATYLHNTLDTVAKQDLFTCLHTPVSISALLAYQPTQIVWKLSALAGVVTPATDVTDNAPVAVDTEIVNGSVYYRYTLAGSYQFNTADTFYLPLVLTNPTIDKCDHTEQIAIPIVVKPEPLVDFSFAHQPDCSLDTLRVTSVANTTDGYTLQSWSWQFPGGETATGITASHVVAAGIDLPVILSVVTREGCVADTVKKVTVNTPPAADFSIAPAAACEKGSYAFKGTASYSGTGSIQWYWDFGNGDTTTTVNNPKSETYNKAGEYTVKLVAKAGTLCNSDTASQVVTVYAKPQIKIIYPEGCLPKDGVVTFTNNSTVPDGQAINSHSWNFGDVHATATNPNTSTLASPSHSYTAFDTYNISYEAVSDKGCVTDTVIIATFNLAPTFTFDALSPVCEQTAAFSVAKANVTNNVKGTGIYKGPGVTSAGLFTPATAGVGVHTIWYVFTAASGCTDSVQQTIQVYASPVASFTFVNNACKGDATTFTPTATAAAGEQINQWNWSFGDGNKASFTTGAAFDRTYGTAGSYQVILTVNSSHGCTSVADTQTVVVQPLPVADFSLPDTICMPGGAALFTNKSTLTNNGTLTYQWSFGDGSGTSTLANPSYTYATAGSYQVQLTATSAYGCQTVVSKTENQFFNRPVAAFTALPQEICQGAAIVFTDKSTLAGNAVSNWTWNFGDGTTSDVEAPDKTFADAGVFDVSLVVKSAQGCSSTPVVSTVTVHRQPVVDAGSSFTVKEGTRVQFDATADASTYSFEWQPPVGLSSATDLHPYLTVTEDRLYTLTAKGDFNCTATDSMMVSVLRQVLVPNIFTPNGDGVHDVWEIAYLADYTNSVTDVYNRYGQQVYHSNGYATPWNGRMNGKELPVGTYYYVINLGMGAKPISGNVTIVR